MGRHFREALQLETRLNSHTRFRWLDDAEDEYFEFRLRMDELTNDVSLTITDFCDSDEQEENQMLWDTSIQQLRNRIGA